METCTFSTFSGKLASSLVFPLMPYHFQRTTGRPGPLSNLAPFNVILFQDSKWEAWASIPRQQKGGLGLCSQTAKGRPGPVPLFPDSKREAWASIPSQQTGGLGLGLYFQTAKGLFSGQQNGDLGLGLYSQTAKGRPGSLTNFVPLNAILFSENKMEARFDQTSSGQRTRGTVIKTSSNSGLLWSGMPVGNWPWGLHL